MSNSTAFDSSEAWRYEGWTDLDERATAGAIDTDGSLILVGIQGDEALADYPFLGEIGGDFAAVKLLSSGEELWSWIDPSSVNQTGVWLAVDTDSENNVSKSVGGGENFGSRGWMLCFCSSVFFPCLVPRSTPQVKTRHARMVGCLV